MKLTYVGRHTAVEVDLPNGGGFEVEHGKTTPDLPAEFAASLLEQESNWKAGDKEAQQLAADVARERDTADAPEEK